MYEAKDGKRFGNTEMGKHYDKTRPSSEGGKERVKTGNKAADESMDDVVAEHGPAEHVEIHSHHKDGHMHKAEHHTHQEAREHIDKAFGEEPEGMKSDHEEPDGDEGMSAGKIPGIG